MISLFNNIASNDCSKSFEKLYNHYYNRLFRQALYYLNNNHDHAQEVVANLFVSLWQSRKVLDKVSNPDSYLFIALKYSVGRYIERNYNKSPELIIDNLPDNHHNEHGDSQLIERELFEKYRLAVESLPPRCAQIFRLVREEQKKYSEVAEQLNISVKTVDNQMVKAVKLLYDQLKEHFFSIYL